MISPLILVYKARNNNSPHNHDHKSIDFSSENEIATTYPNTDILEEKPSSSKGRILIVDDDPDIALSFSMGLKDDGFEVYIYTDPLDALSNFKPSFYDLLLVDINMPKMNGFELCQKILNIDLNVKICYITAGDINIDALREIYATLSTGCFIKKPITITDLIKRLRTELDL